MSCSLLGLFTCSSGLLPKKETNKNGKLLRNEKSNTQLQYDSASYALNFDDGAQKDDAGFPCFADRYANPMGHKSATGVNKETK